MLITFQDLWLGNIQFWLDGGKMLEVAKLYSSHIQLYEIYVYNISEYLMEFNILMWMCYYIDFICWPSEQRLGFIWINLKILKCFTDSY